MSNLRFPEFVCFEGFVKVGPDFVGQDFDCDIDFALLRSDLIALAKILMATPAVMLLGIDFARRVQVATNPQR